MFRGSSGGIADILGNVVIEVKSYFIEVGVKVIESCV